MQARALARNGRLAEAARAFEEASDIARAMPYPYAEATALLSWGHAAAECGVDLQSPLISADESMTSTHGHRPTDRSTAQQRLETAAAIFRRLGATHDADEAERALAEPSLR